MDTAGIRQTVAAAVDHEARTGDLFAKIRAAYAAASPSTPPADLDQKAEAAVLSVKAFVVAMPEIIDAAIEAATKAGIADRLRPVFQAAIEYVDEEIDFIPDTLGLGGLMDDAYLVHSLMQEISHRHRTQLGNDLIPRQYFAETQRIRRMIGEPTSTRLDIAIVAFARRNNVRQTIEQIFERIGGDGMAMDLPVAAELGGEGPLDELPSLDLGGPNA